MKCLFMHGNAFSRVSKLTHEFFKYKKIYGREDNRTATIKSWSEFDGKSMVNCEDEIYEGWKYYNKTDQ